MTHADLALWRYSTFCAGVRSICTTFKASITSWWRSPTHNATLEGSVEDSEHQLGTAVDVVFDPGTEPPAGYFVAFCRELGITATKEKDHWHLQLLTTLAGAGQ